MSTPATQLDLVSAMYARDTGIEQVSDNNQVFLETMRGYARRIYRNRGYVTSDDLRVIADDIGLQPHHPNAWGAIFAGNDWQCIGRMKSAYKPNHAREIKKWAFKGKA